jgi:hypothetical protein
MLCVKFVNDLPTEVSAECQQGAEWQSRWNWKSLERVETIAKYLTAITGKLYIGTDSGGNSFPRYDIAEVPAIGDPVSYAFNGDYYPDGVVTKISPKLMVTTSTGSTYRRRGNSGSWRKAGGTWSLVAGHINRLNPLI